MTTPPDRTRTIGPAHGQWLETTVAALAPDDHATTPSWKPVTVLVAVALTTGVLGFGIGASLGADDKSAALEVVDLRTELVETQRQRSILEKRVAELEAVVEQAG
ncbi:hypothetical protein IGS67_01925 [Flavimobilis sp. GY10621]|uniref:M23 family peptidase n=1 Tax=Flavimobilis rhizosphaerae TaxID=2775421 RepID=A0ABR9DM92_9MICO|nr:hypothetical protein [Flavimobilis rhizosphaerae]MBD9698252.1 hypothetical protein [Flavimobilis rhizosphaerae]